MLSKLFASGIVIAGILVGWPADSNGSDRVFAAEKSYSGHALAGLETRESTARPDKGSLRLVIEGKSPMPGAPVAPQVVPRPAIPPKLRAETNLPPELLQAQQFSRAPGPLQPFPETPEGRLGKVRLFSQTNALPPPAATPPELQMLGQITSRSNAPPKPSPSIAELLNRLSTLPGGRQAIEEAKRRGAQISQAPHSERSLLSSLNSVFGIRDADAAQGFSVTFTPREPKNSLLSFIGVWLWAPYVPQLDPGIHMGGPAGAGGWAMFQVTVPQDGMYLVNIEAFSMQAKARLESGGTVIGSWDFSGTTAALSFPTLVELAAGLHNFIWIVERSIAEFKEASISSL